MISSHSSFLPFGVELQQQIENLVNVRFPEFLTNVEASWRKIDHLQNTSSEPETEPMISNFSLYIQAKSTEILSDCHSIDAKLCEMKSKVRK
jgi:hypothetical protein